MPLDLIGAGMPRTGTESLKRALEMLGFGPCYHMIELIARPDHLSAWEAAARAPEETDYERLLAGYRAAVDFPAMLHWRRLATRYPAARVILTVRDPAAWHASLERTVLAAARLASDDPVTRRRRRMVHRDLVDGLFHGRAHEPAFMAGLFAAHRRAVTQALAPGRLLVLETGAGWKPLCDFLGVAVPACAYPFDNDAETFRRRYLAT